MVRKQLSIESAEDRDLPEILGLQKIAYQIEADRYKDPGLPPMKQTIEEMTEEFADHLFLKACVYDRLVGSVRLGCKKRTGFIGKLIVHPDFQQHGIGRILMQEIENAATHVDRFELFTGNYSTPPLKLYESMGYREFKQKALDSHTLIFLEKQVDNR